MIGSRVNKISGEIYDLLPNMVMYVRTKELVGNIAQLILNETFLLRLLLDLFD